jgi:hypothetical protein
MLRALRQHLPRRPYSLREKLLGTILLTTMVPLLATIWVLSTAAETRLRSSELEEGEIAGERTQALVQERAQRLAASAQAIALSQRLRDATLARDRSAMSPEAANRED